MCGRQGQRPRELAFRAGEKAKGTRVVGRGGGRTRNRLRRVWDLPVGLFMDS